MLAVVAQQPTQKGMPSLTRLDLSHSLSSLDEGDQAKALRAMVSSNGALRELDVSCNQLEEEQLVLLDALAENKTLRKLLLAENCLGNEGVPRLCNALMRNDSLLEIDARDNLIDSDDAGAQLYGALANNRTMLECRLEVNVIAEQYRKMIEEHLNFNKTVKGGGGGMNESLMIQSLTCDDAFKQAEGSLCCITFTIGTSRASAMRGSRRAVPKRRARRSPAPSRRSRAR